MNVAGLVELGFVEAGVCALDPALKSGVRFTLHRHQGDRVIYAFVVGEEVKYIGVCDNTKTCFSDRMSRYQGIMGAGTNERVVGYIKAAFGVGQGDSVTVGPRCGSSPGVRNSSFTSGGLRWIWSWASRSR